MMRGGFNRLLNETVLCKKSGFCRYLILIPDDVRKYTYRVLKDKPPIKRPNIEPDSGNFTFVAFSEVHVDHYYTPGIHTYTTKTI